MAIVPEINQYLNYYKIPIPTGYVHNVVSFVIKESTKASIRTNNAILNADDIVFEDSLLAGNITYSGVSILVTQGEFKAFTLDGERFGIMGLELKKAKRTDYPKLFTTIRKYLLFLSFK